MTTEPKGLPKRDALVAIEHRAQQMWEAERMFETDASATPTDPKFFVTFPYPYMNGKLHMGHAFSISKPEFAVGFERLQGKRTLFPFGFHVTGMPIKACADKLAREITLFGYEFERYVPSGQDSEPVVAAIAAESADPSKKKKHGKATSKNTGLTYQFQIMRSMGVPNAEIQRFADPKYWLSYFPPIAMRDLKRFGAHIDWRRSFITTDVNPYYDSFIRWQFNQLRKAEPSKIQFGERYTIYSPLDGQACMDHDRASGEGVGVQEYTGIKLQVLLDELNKVECESRFKIKDVPACQKLSSMEFKDALGSSKLFMVAATLRPETMYGQTNCFVGVDLDYGVYAVNEHEAWICTERAAKNMAWQGLFAEKGVLVKLLDLKGIDLVGAPLSAPLSSYPIIYTLPMENVLANKGTGVVTSVPSDSPDDYITMMDLLKKAEYYNVSREWVEQFLPPKPIIRTPNFGDLAAVAAVEKLKIASQKDKKQLAEAKEMVYKEGFYSGTIIVGEFSGKSVQEVKPLIRKYLIEKSLAFAYCEPEGLVISRSGDECVVTLASQWYMDYGEGEWKQKALLCLDRMETFSEETRNAFKKTLDWLCQWACSRSFGLGSRLPWDPEWLIESLSDSTIYMAYYTVAHILQGGVIDGSKPGPAGVVPDQMTDSVWSYIMLEGPLPNDSTIAQETLFLMRSEFQYFYPLDLRCSGKDLINNHLTFFLYNHTAIFPEKNWPKAIRANGHLLLNNEKMSKSTGNFLTVGEAMDRYGADATRFALADAGDGIEDANFLEKTADDAILKLHTELEWIQENISASSDNRTGQITWNDQVFAAEMDKVIVEAKTAYESMLYREALKVSFYDLQNVRNEYRKATTGQGLSLSTSEVFEGMHRDLVVRFAETLALLLSPITPHWSEGVWMEILKKGKSIMHSRWPTVASDKSSENLLSAAKYVQGLGARIRSAEDAAKKKSKKKVVESPGPKVIRVFVAEKYPVWQDQVMNVLKSSYNPESREFSGKERDILKECGLLSNKQVMPFVAKIKKDASTMGKAAFDRELLFSESQVLESNLDYIRRDLAALKISKVEVIKKEGLAADLTDDDRKKAEMAVPGAPTYRIV